MKSSDFSKACILGLAIILPIVVGVKMEVFEIGLAMALGSLLCSSSDVSGSLRHKKYGILLSAVLATLASLIGGYFIQDSIFGLLLLGGVMFSISYLSVFGFRASLIAFSGLFAMVLSFANISEALEVYERALLIGLGGIWYLGLTTLYQIVNPKAQTNQYLAQSINLTAQYLETRGRLIAEVEQREKLLGHLLDLQSELNEKHEILRDLLISTRKSSGNSNYERRRLLVFIQLVDILELAMANPVNYAKIDLLRKEHPENLEAFRDLIFAMSGRLHAISDHIDNLKTISKHGTLTEKLEKLKNMLPIYSEASGNGNREIIMLQNLLNYQVKQVQNINKIERLLSNSDEKDLDYMHKEEAVRFLTPQEFDFKVLRENFSLKSSVFKHSLRLAVVVIVGYWIGAYFSLQNAYWILLTIIVIMRPNYGLTKTRSKQRTLGTLIGAGIAIGVVLITQNLILYGILAVISLVLAFSMVQKNYKASAVFVTLSVVFVYALLEPNVLDVIQFRVVDTLIGAGLATVGNLFLWPSWEIHNIKVLIIESIRANKEYLKEVTNLYEKKGRIPTTYKLSRKSAFLGMGELNSAFQRMTQEPKSRQKDLKHIYELVVLNHSFLSSLASMGTYIQNHTTTEASTHFRTFARSIDENLNKSLAILTQGDYQGDGINVKQQEAEHFFEHKFHELSRGIPLSEARVEGDILQETQLIYEQLKWLMEISEKLIKNISVVKLNTSDE